MYLPDGKNMSESDIRPRPGLSKLEGVDLPAYWLIPSVDRIKMVDDLSEEVKQGRISHRFFYWDVECSYNWVKLEVAPDYALSKQARQMVDCGFELIHNRIIEKVTKPYDIVNLGVGTGVDDIIMLRTLSRFTSNEYSGTDVSYFPVDISYDLLLHTLRNVSEDEAIAKDAVVAYVLNGDFQKLTTYKNTLSRLSTGPKLFTFLGSTLSNYREGELLEKIRDTMGPDDFLLLGVDCIYERKTPAAIKRIYEKSESGKRFLLGPIRSIQSLARPREFPHLTDLRARDLVTEAYMAYDKSDLKEENAAVTVVHVLKGEGFGSLELNLTHKYKLEPLADFLTKQRFTTVKDPIQPPQVPGVGAFDDCYYVFFLLRKSEQKSPEEHTELARNFIEKHILEKLLQLKEITYLKRYIKVKEVDMLLARFDPDNPRLIQHIISKQYIDHNPLPELQVGGMKDDLVAQARDYIDILKNIAEEIPNNDG